MIQQTSIQAYYDVKYHDLNQRQYEVLNILNQSFFGLSNRLIAKRLNKPVNEITPRTNELVKIGIVEKKYAHPDLITKKSVIFWGIKE